MEILALINVQMGNMQIQLMCVKIVIQIVKHAQILKINVHLVNLQAHTPTSSITLV